MKYVGCLYTPAGQWLICISTGGAAVVADGCLQILFEQTYRALWGVLL
jgi:hypothetical protein